MRPELFERECELLDYSIRALLDTPESKVRSPLLKPYIDECFEHLMRLKKAAELDGLQSTSLEAGWDSFNDRFSPFESDQDEWAAF